MIFSNHHLRNFKKVVENFRLILLLYYNDLFSHFRPLIFYVEIIVSMKSVKWQKKKKAKFLAKFGDDKIRELFLEDDKVSTFVLLGNAGLLNGYNSVELSKLFGHNQFRAIFPFDRNYCVVEFEAIQKSEGLSETLKSCDQENCPMLFYLSGMPVFNYFNIDPCKEMPSGVKLIEDFLSNEEEQIIMAFIDSLGKEKDSNLKRRQAWHFGYTFDYSSNQISEVHTQPLPQFCSDFLIKRLMESGLFTQEPDQMTINVYNSGDGIPFHVESSCFGDEVVSISLLSPLVMEIRPSSLKLRNERPLISLLLDENSALGFSKEARLEWGHGIASRKTETVVSKQNGDYITTFLLPDKENEKGNLLIPSSSLTFGALTRKYRISLTFRKVVNKKPISDVKLPSHLDGVSNDDLHHLEHNFVKDVYEAVASDFSSTRHTPWPQVADFVGKIPPGSILADIGCGNGRYFNVNQNIFVIGSDNCENLLKIASTKTIKCNCAVSDCCNIALKSNSVDAAICIAVIHHLASTERRKRAIKEISRIIRPGGKGLIYVWAVEQQDANTGEISTYTAAKSGKVDDSNGVVFTTENDVSLPVHKPRTAFSALRQDCFVPWKKGNHSSLRYYHVFNRGELENLFDESTVEVSRTYFDEGNWCVEFVKKHS